MDSSMPSSLQVDAAINLDRQGQESADDRPDRPPDTDPTPTPYQAANKYVSVADTAEGLRRQKAHPEVIAGAQADEIDAHKTCYSCKRPGWGHCGML